MTIFSKSITIMERESWSKSDLIWSIHWDQGHPFLLFPSIMPCIMTFSKLLPLHFTIWPKQLSIWMLMVCKSRLDTPISSSILALVLLLVHGMQSMRPSASSTTSQKRSALFWVQVSEAYKAIGNTRTWTSLTLVVLVTPLSAHIFDRFVIAVHAIAKRCESVFPC